MERIIIYYNKINYRKRVEPGSDDMNIGAETIHPLFLNLSSYPLPLAPLLPLAPPRSSSSPPSVSHMSLTFRLVSFSFISIWSAICDVIKLLHCFNHLSTWHRYIHTSIIIAIHSLLAYLCLGVYEKVPII